MCEKEDKKDLTEKQKQFCQEYMIDFNATQAAIRAGYKNTNAVGVTAYENLRKPYIQEYLQGLLQKQAEKADLSVEWVIQELKKLYERCTAGRLEVHGATKSLEMLGKYLGMWIEKHDHAGEVGLEIIHTYVDAKDRSKTLIYGSKGKIGSNKKGYNNYAYL